jgi:endo-1,4-beta-xylanase
LSSIFNPLGTYSSILITMKLSLVSMVSVAALVSAAPVTEPEVFDARQAAESINARMVAKGRKYFGTCTDQNLLNTGSNAAIIKANFGQVTPENRYAEVASVASS